MKKVALMQPYLFPYLGYWQLIHAVDLFIIYDDVNYIKGGWINRNCISLNHAPHFLTLSLSQASPFKKINETLIHPDKKNKTKMLGLLESAYRAAPFFKIVFPLLKTCIDDAENNLSLFLEKKIKMICEYLAIKTPIVLSSSIRKKDFLTGQDRVIDICQNVNATHYINAIGGKELYSESEFNAANMDLAFLQSQSMQYAQFSEPFIPNLSIIDVMMFNDSEKIQQALNKFNLIR